MPNISNENLVSKINKELLKLNNNETAHFLIGIQSLYMSVSVSAIKQSESAIYTHIPTLFWISFPFRSPENTE